MKKKIISLLTAAVIVASTAFANSTEPSQQAQTTFNRMFANATEVKWEAASPLEQVSFKTNGQYLTAFFATDGHIQSVARHINTTSLPLILQKDLQDKMANAWLSESFELFGENGTEYYATLENAKTKTIYHATGTEWEKYKTIEK